MARSRSFSSRSDRLARRTGTWVLWWLALLGLWILIVGTNTALEIGAGACAAAIGATAQELVRAQGPHSPSLDLRFVGGAWRLPWEIVREFAVVTWALAVALVRRRPLEGAFRRIDLPKGAGRRAFLVSVGTMAPNTYVVDVEAGARTALVHDLVQTRARKRPL
jgi:Na+/H+ ion antiporter subunit